MTAPTLDLDNNGFGDLIVSSIVSARSDGLVRVFSGDDLWQNATPSRPKVGARLDLSTREGVPGSPTILVLEEVDGTPTFQILDGLATFDSTGGRIVSGTVPSGLAGHDLTLRGYALDAAGDLIRSAAQVVRCR